MENKKSYKGAIILTVMSLVIFYMPDISPRSFWYSSFLGLLIPLVIVALILSFFYWAAKRNVLFLLPLVILVVHWKLLQRTITFSSEESQKEEFSVLSYNIRLFNVYPQFADKTFSTTRKIIDFVKKSEADILCLQEFYNNPKDTLFNTTFRIKKKYPYFYYSETFRNNSGGTFGMVIFSKFPIKSYGKVVFQEGSNNQTIYADVELPQATVRVSICTFNL